MRCGVSTATVSKALNGYQDVGEATRQRVQAVAKELGYTANSAARALKTNRSYNIGILFMDLSNSGFTHEYFASTLTSFRLEAERCGYDILFISNNMGRQSTGFLQHALFRGVDGVAIICADFHDPQVQELVYSDLPVITLDHAFNNRPAVLSDNMNGLESLVHYVYEKGHRRIAYIHGNPTAVTENRMMGFYRACEALGLTIPDAYIAECEYHEPISCRAATEKLLALPTLGVTVFTILPIFFMILVAFTNFDYNHQPPSKLFTWVGFENFKTLLSSGSASYGDTFRQVLFWTLVWAFFATFLNYFLGMFVAIMINKKGIKLKKMWRTILVMTIAIPQFVSLLYVSKMFAADGLINTYLMKWHWISQPIPFWTNPGWARFTIILINIWIGIPYLMLIATGILMNIPADLYESARIDGANAMQMYGKITLPYMLFVTGPYLLTSFTGNINNFNVIFLLSQGKPMGLSGNAGYTDLLITWLYRMTVSDTNYKIAAVIGIMVFVVLAVINLVVYNLIPSVKNEEDFQ